MPEFLSKPYQEVTCWRSWVVNGSSDASVLWMVLPGGPGGQADDDMPMVELKQEVSEDHGGPQSSSQATFCLNNHNWNLETTFLHILVIPGWWFGTFFIFPNSWDDDPIWRTPSFFRGVGQPPTTIHWKSAWKSIQESWTSIAACCGAYKPLVASEIPQRSCWSTFQCVWFNILKSKFLLVNMKHPPNIWWRFTFSWSNIAPFCWSAKPLPSLQEPKKRPPMASFCKLFSMMDCKDAMGPGDWKAVGWILLVMK